MSIYLIALLIVLSTACDRIRGGGGIFPLGRPLWLERGAKFGQGAVLAYLALCPYWLLPVAAVLFWLGEKPGWGYPIGMAYHDNDLSHDKTPHGPEWWQPQFTYNRPYLALALRGVIWGLPLWVLSYWWHYAVFISVSMAISMPLSVYLAKPLKRTNYGTFHEQIRGFLSAALLVPIVLYT